jgi:hypothetical protein
MMIETICLILVKARRQGNKKLVRECKNLLRKVL